MAELERQQRVRRVKTQALPTVTLRRHGELLPVADNDALESAAVGPQGQLVTVWTNSGGEVRQGAATARVVEYWPAPALTMSVTGLRMSFPTAQPLPDGKTLLVDSRRKLGPNGLNAAIYDDSGTLITTGTLRDGIEHVRTTTSGRIWVGYFDEGVYGDDPISSCGLARFNSSLEPEWRYTAPGGIGPIDDCYALNVTDHEVWTCYYNSFPVVRIRGDDVIGWHNGRAAHALLAQGAIVALASGYRPEHDWIAVGTVGAVRLEIEREYRLTLPDGSGLPTDAQLFGHGSVLHVVTGTVWYKISLDDVVT